MSVLSRATGASRQLNAKDRGMEDIEFIEVEDVRKTGMKILLGRNSVGKTYHAIYKNRMVKAVDAIRARFKADADAAAEPVFGDEDGWG